MNPTLLIHLEDKHIDSFRAKERHLSVLREAFPTLNLEQAHSQKDFLERLPEVHFVWTWYFEAEWYAQAPSLKAVFTPAAGKEWVQSDPSGKVPVHYGSYHGRIIAETMIGMVLHFSRALGKAMELKQQVNWERHAFDGTRVLKGQRALVVGLGNIGQHFARLLRVFGLHVTGVKQNPGNLPVENHAHEVLGFAKLGEVIPRADHVIMALPGVSETDGLITRAHLKSMKPTAIFYNFGRGNCVREEDLVWALQEKEIAGAGLDVFAQEPLSKGSDLWSRPDVLLLPHASCICEEYLDYHLEEIIEHLKRHLPRD